MALLGCVRRHLSASPEPASLRLAFNAPSAAGDSCWSHGDTCCTREAHSILAAGAFNYFFAQIKFKLADSMFALRIQQQPNARIQRRAAQATFDEGDAMRRVRCNALFGGAVDVGTQAA